MLIGAGGAYIVNKQGEGYFENGRDIAQRDLNLLQILITESLQIGSYEDVASLINEWGKQNQDVVRLELRSPNGFVIGKYLRTAEAKIPHEISSEISYSYRGRAKIEFVVDLFKYEQQRQRIAAEVLLVFASVLIFGIYITYLSQKRHEESEHLRDATLRVNHTNKVLDREVQQRRKAEHELYKEKEHAEVTLQSIGDGVIATDTDSRITRMNTIAEHLTGWKEKQAIGKPLKEILHLSSASRDQIENPVETVLRRGKIVGLSNDTKITAKDGKTFQIADSAAPIYSHSGAIEGVVMVFRDVSEEYKVKKALIDSERRLRKVTDNLTEHFLYSHDTDGVIGYVTASIKGILGYTPEEFYTHYSEYLTDNPINRKVEEYTEKSIRGIPQPPYELEIKHKNGDTRILEVKETPVFGKNGEVLSIEGIAQDITLRKFQESELQLAASVFEETSEGIIVTNRNGVIVRANRGFWNISGYRPEEIIGTAKDKLLSENNEPELCKKIYDAVDRDGGWRGEVWVQTVHREHLPAWLSVVGLKKQEGSDEQNYISIFSDISSLKQAQEEIARLAFRDDLTDLPNRTFFIERLEAALSRAIRNKEIGGLLFLDLDHFKNINDSLGHNIGDQLLVEVANRLKKQIRQEDICARLGGDEFVVILTDLDFKLNQAAFRAHFVAEKIRQELAKPYEIEGHVLHTSPSIGISLFPSDSAVAEDVLKHADKAMYKAKESGRNDIHFFTPEMQSNAEIRLTLETELRQALEEQQFVLHYQPQIEMETYKVVGAEALIRWDHPERGLVFPDRFISIAEESGLIVPIGDWVIKTACRQLKQWQNLGLDVFPMAVNLSAVQFRQTDLVAKVERLLRSIDFPPQLLDLEITESLLMENVNQNQDTIRDFAEMGVKLSVDDFGTGYSSLSYLRRFKVNKLKIDKSFIDDIPQDEDDLAITRSIIQMAKSLNLHTVAEGVESELQLKFLRENGCDQVQGYYFSKPLPAEQFFEFAERNQ